MSFQDPLQKFAAPDGVFVVGIEGALTGDAVVDAHVKALAAGQTLTIVHGGKATAVAQRMAARFGATLVDAATILAAEPSVAAAEPVVSDAPVESVIPPVPALPEMPSLLPAPETPVLLPGHVGPIAEEAVEGSLIIAASEPAPEVAHAPTAPPLLEEGELPWTMGARPEDDVTLTIPEDEFEAMPWNVVHTQIISSGRKNRLDAPRPTTVPDWGLPWPRPVAPTDGLAVADPRLWHTQERLQAVRDDLDRAGAPSFGVAKPDAREREGSAWLKRLHDFGSP